MEKTLSVGQAFGKAWSWWQAERDFVYRLMLPMLVVAVVSAVLFSTGGIITSLLGLIAQIVYIFVAMCVTASLLFFVSSGQKEDWKDWKKYGRVFPKFILVSILYGLMVFVGLLLFIAPGIYVAVRYAFSGYYFLEHPEANIETIFRESARITAGNRLTVLLIIILSVLAAGIVMGIVGFIIGGMNEPWFSIGTELAMYLLVTPLVTLTSIAAYDFLKSDSSTEAKEAIVEPVANEKVAEEAETAPVNPASSPEPAA